MGSACYESKYRAGIRQTVLKFSGLNLGARHTDSNECPICHHKGCFSYYPHETPERFKCFSLDCGKSGTVIDLVMELKGITDPNEAGREICNAFGIPFDEPKQNISDSFKHYLDVYKYANELFRNAYNNFVGTDKDYWSSRGLTRKTINEFELGYCPSFFTDKKGNVVSFRDLIKAKFPDVNADDYGLYYDNGDCRFADRYIIPIRNSFGQIIAFSGRSLVVSDNKKKYVNSPTTAFFKKDSVLFNYNNAKGYDKLYVVEGYMDALSLYQSGVKNVVASMGTAFTSTNIKSLSAQTIVLALDNDSAGMKSMYTYIVNNRDIIFYVCLLDDYKDLNEALMSGANLKALVSKRLMTGPEYIIRYFVSTQDMSLLETRKELYIQLAKLIGSDNDKYLKYYPINTLYNPFEFDYYWTKAKHLVKGRKRG